MRRLALIVLACGGEAQVHALAAQVAAHIEAGFSEVKYDGFLLSGALALSPTMRWEHPRGRGFVSARGTYLHFESGRHSLDASATGSWFTFKALPGDAFTGRPDDLWQMVLRRQGGMMAAVALYPADPALN